MEKCKAHGQPRLIGACEWQRLAHVTGTRVRAMAAQSGENQNAVYDKKATKHTVYYIFKKQSFRTTPWRDRRKCPVAIWMSG